MQPVCLGKCVWLIFIQSAKIIQFNVVGFSEQLQGTSFFIKVIYVEHICMVKFSINVLKTSGLVLENSLKSP